MNISYWRTIIKKNIPRFSIHLLIHISDTVIQEVRRYCFCILVTYHFDWKRYSPSFVYETSRSVADSVIITIISNDNLQTKRPPVRQFTQKGATMYPEDIIRKCTGIFYLLVNFVILLTLFDHLHPIVQHNGRFEGIRSLVG